MAPPSSSESLPWPYMMWFTATSRGPLLLLLSLHSAPDTSLLFLELAKHAPTYRSFYLSFPLPGMLFFLPDSYMASPLLLPGLFLDVTLSENLSLTNFPSLSAPFLCYVFLLSTYHHLTYYICICLLCDSPEATARISVPWGQTLFLFTALSIRPRAVPNA